MQQVRMRTDDAKSLSREMGTATQRTRDATAELSPIVTRALALLDRPGQHPLYGPIPALHEVANEVARDQRDLDWRIDWLELSDARPMGATGYVEALVPESLEEALRLRGLDDVYADLVHDALARGVGLEAALAEAEARQFLDDLAESVDGSFYDDGPSPFEPATIADIDARIDALHSAHAYAAPWQQPAIQIEVHILVARRDAMAAELSGSRFVLTPSQLVDRLHDDYAEYVAFLQDRWYDEAAVQDAAATYLALHDFQVSRTRTQIREFVTAEHTLTNAEERTLDDLLRLGQWHLSPGTVAERNEFIESLVGDDHVKATRFNELLAAGLPPAVALRLARISNDAEALADHAGILRDIYGMTDTGVPRHEADDLGLSEAHYRVGLTDDAIAEFLELDLRFADQQAPPAVLNDDELAAIDLLEINYDAFVMLMNLRELGYVETMHYGPYEELHWHHLEMLANGEFLLPDYRSTDGHSSWDYFVALYPDLAETLSADDVQEIAQLLLDNPRAWNMLAGAHDGTEVLNAEHHGFADTDGQVVTPGDFGGFDQQRRLRDFLYPFLSQIDTAGGGSVDHTLSANDFAEWMIDRPDLPHELRDMLHQAIDDGLTDKGGWDRLFRALEISGLILAGATLLALPGGNVVLLSSLAGASVVVGLGEAYAAHEAGHDDLAAWALAGVALDLIDVAEVASLGFGVAAARAARRAGRESAALAIEELLTESPTAFRALDELFDSPRIRSLANAADARDPVALARLELELIAGLTSKGIPIDEATAHVGNLLAAQRGNPGFPRSAFDAVQEAFAQHPDHIDFLADAFGVAENPGELAARLASLSPGGQDIAAELLRRYELAGPAKIEIDRMARELANRYDGDLATAPIKGFSRALTKALEDGSADLKDLARNTIVVDADQVDDVVADLTELGADVKVFEPANNPLGYSGYNTTFVTDNGLVGEVQVNTPQMIFAKEEESIARSILGNDVYDDLVGEFGDIGGRGHTYYEEYRELPPNHPDLARIEAESQAYYDQFRPAEVPD